MELYQWIALGVLVAMGFVVHSTLRLNGFRKDKQIGKDLINLRDLTVFRNPDAFDPEEVRLVRKNWGGCAALLVLFLLLLITSPEDVLKKVEQGSPAYEAPPPVR